MTTDVPLEGAHAVITGGGRGIGLAIAQRLSSLGATLTLIGRDRSRLFDAVQSLPATSRCDVQVCDVTDTSAVRRAFDAIARAGARPTILVNNAGVAKSAKVGSTDDALWNEMIGVNLTGTFNCTRAALRMLADAKAGRVVNIASTAGLVGYPYVAAYCAAKHGVIGLTRALALELAGTRVTVNAVCPGYTDTDLVGDAVQNIVDKTGKTREEARAALSARNPQKRLITPDEVANAVAWLCLPASQSITGQAIAVAGGEVTRGMMRLREPPLLQHMATADPESRLHDDHHDALRLWLRLLTCTLLIERQIKVRLRERFAITLPRFDLMAQLERAPSGLKMSELSRRLMVTGGSVTGLTDQLVGEGLVERRRVPGDRRAHAVSLTVAGRKAFRAMADEHERWIVELLRGVTDNDRDRLYALLGRLKRGVAVDGEE